MKDTKIHSYSVVEERILLRKSAQYVPQNPLTAVAAITFVLDIVSLPNFGVGTNGVNAQEPTQGCSVVAGSRCYDCT